MLMATNTSTHSEMTAKRFTGPVASGAAVSRAADPIGSAPLRVARASRASPAAVASAPQSLFSSDASPCLPVPGAYDRRRGPSRRLEQLVLPAEDLAHGVVDEDAPD